MLHQREGVGAVRDLFHLMIGLYGIAFWLPTIVKAFGMKGYLRVGLITAIPYGVAVIGMIFLSNHSDKTGERRLHYVANVVAGAVGLVLSGVFASNHVLAIIFLSVGTLGVIGSMPLFWPLPSAFLAGTAVAAGIGIVNSVGNLGGYVGPNIPIWARLFFQGPIGCLVYDCGDFDGWGCFDVFLYPANSTRARGCRELAVGYPYQATLFREVHGENILAVAFVERSHAVRPALPEGIWQGYDGEWRYVSRQLVALAEATPAEKFAWRPEAGVRSTSEVYMHIAMSNFYLLSVTGPKMPAGLKEDAEKTVTSKAEVIDWLKRSLDAVKEAHLAEKTQRS